MEPVFARNRFSIAFASESSENLLQPMTMVMAKSVAEAKSKTQHLKKPLGRGIPDKGLDEGQNRDDIRMRTLGRAMR